MTRTQKEQLILGNIEKNDIKIDTGEEALILTEVKSKINDLKEETKRLSDEIIDIKKSRSWKLTRPLRKLNTHFKRK
jgi:hypothetical protein